MAKNLDFNYIDLNLKRNEILSLDSDVVLAFGEGRKFKKGIEIKSKHLILDGNGHTFDAKGKARFFNILEEGSITIENVNFKNGSHKLFGGAIRNAGKCKLINCTFENNKAGKNGDDVSNGSDLTISQCKFSKSNSVFNEHGSVYLFDDEEEDLKPFISGGKIKPVDSFNIDEDALDSSIEDDSSELAGDVGASIGLSPSVMREQELDDGIKGEIKLGAEDSGDVVLSHKNETPFDAYAGDGPYIFISYKHADSKIVYPVITEFRNQGFNIWYDDGLPLGKKYDIQIVKHIRDSALFITFITETSMACAYNEEDYLIKEFSIARHFSKNILPIYLDDVELDGFYLIHLLGIQSIFRHDYGNNDNAFIKACVDAFINEFDLPKNCPK